MPEFKIKDNFEKEYLIEIEPIDYGSFDGSIFLAKIKAPDDKYFTYEFRLSGRFLSSEYAPSSIEDYLVDKARKVIIEKKINEDRIIEVRTVGQNIYKPEYELKKHSSYYERNP